MRYLTTVLRAMLAMLLAIGGVVALTASPAQADVVGGCTIVESPTPANRTNCNLKNMSGVDLSGRDLRWARFNLSNLAGANFSGANLSNATITWNNMTGANFSNVNFAGASFDGVYSVAGANFSGSSMMPSNISVNSDDAQPVAVNFPGDGTSGITRSCLPGSGATFPVGTTTVGCIFQLASQISYFTVTVNDTSVEPTITGDATATAVQGASFTYTPTVAGVPTPTVTLQSGSLPTGLSLAANGVISGTASGALGDYPVTLRASNAVGQQDHSLTITVATIPTITGDTTATGLVGTAFTYTPTVTGSPAPTVTSGTLPDGLTLAPATGVITGTPTVGSGGLYPTTLTATNSAGSDTHDVDITINEVPGITGAASTTFTEGTAGSYSPTSVTGYPAPTVTSTTLPGGLTIDSATGQITGSPDAGTNGEYDVTLTATNGVDPPATLDLHISVTQAPSINGAATATFIEGQAGSYLPDPIGGYEAPVVTQSGLPSGLTVDSATGAITGTPDAGTSGTTYPVTLTATNSAGVDTLDVALTVHLVPDLGVGPPAGDVVVGEAYGFTPTLTGFPAPTVALTGVLPSGLFFSAATGEISGTLGENAVGSYPITMTASNAAGEDSLSFTIEVVAGEVDSMVITPSDSTPLQGSTISLDVEGFDEFGNSTGDVTPDVTFASSVPSDDIDGDEVTFNHASPHTITGTHSITGTEAQVTVEVTPRLNLGSLLPDTGGVAAGLLKLGISFIVIGAFLVAQRRPSGRRLA